ncbi:MAG: hypothetical protein KatS3mg113_0459 [Planctomycetaceae bacterium]|nr:MAG: hypothetical protein KatS3mg113_0459 [Planctomycetaceae bacterium]
MQVRRMRTRPRRYIPQAESRRGAATVEFAVLAPLFIALTLGAIQHSYYVDAYHKLHAAIRQAGRLASQDYRSLLQPGQTANGKIINDIRNQLKAEGLSADQFEITITHAEGPLAGMPFDLSSPANSLQLFRIKVEAPISAFSAQGLFPFPKNKLTASIVFRRPLWLNIEI